MKVVLAAVVTALGAAMPVTAPAFASEFGGSLELGASRTLSGDDVFKESWDLGLAGYRRWRTRYYPGVFVEYRSVVDAEPASSFWFADTGLRFFSVFGRFCGRVDVGWAFRHIALDQEGVSTTVGGPLFGLGAGAVILKTQRGTLDLLAASHLTRAYGTDDFWITDIGLSVLWQL